MFEISIKLIRDALNGQAFRPTRSFNAAVFDAVMTGLASRLEVDRRIDASQIQEKYEQLVQKDSDFLRACDRATADEENVRKRLTDAIRAFQEI